MRARKKFIAFYMSQALRMYHFACCHIQTAYTNSCPPRHQNVNTAKVTIGRTDSSMSPQYWQYLHLCLSSSIPNCIIFFQLLNQHQQGHAKKELV